MSTAPMPRRSVVWGGLLAAGLAYELREIKQGDDGVARHGRALQPARRGPLWDDRHRGDHELAHLQERNVWVTPRGFLRVKARPGGGTETHPYASGALDTYGKYHLPRWWRVSVRARVPAEKGLQSAPLWFRPADHVGGEIDLIEGVNNHGRMYQILHSDYSVGQVRGHERKPFRIVGDPQGTRWHTYTVTKLPGRIVMHVDGRETARFRARDMPAGAFWRDFGFGDTGGWVFRINLIVGSNWTGEPDESTDWSQARVDIDWIKSWRAVRR